MLNLRQIEIFRAFMTSGTVSEAARVLRVSQPAVSAALHHMQDRMGVLLFEKTRGRLVPTPEALELFQEIEAVWARIEHVQRFAADLGRKPRRILRVAASTSLGVHVIPTVLASLMRDMPALRIRVELLTPTLLNAAVLSGECDVGLGVAPVEHAGVTARPIGEAGFLCALPPDHSLAKRSEIDLADLADVRLISHSVELPEGRLIQEAFKARGLEPDVAIEVRSGQSACWCVLAGAGVALIDAFTAGQAAFPDLVTRPLRQSPRLSLCLIRPAGRDPTKAAKSFAAAVARLCAEYYPLPPGIGNAAPSG